MSVVGLKGKGQAVLATPSTLTSTLLKDRDGDEGMPNAKLGVTELRETLRVKLPNTYSGNRKELEVFLL
ncbi:hypothetical protein V498_08535 [Pseudogymnoascus sp. VKM F-4517 (FW-2822)]|nr:hypothetical protein V498_08535 [Pseudogymnoascus sp. VKM F-4517 (FW-2822)]